MKVIDLFKASPSFEAGEMPDEQFLIDTGKYNEQLVVAGMLKSREGLKPCSAGVRVRLSSENCRSLTEHSPRPGTWSPVFGMGNLFNAGGNCLVEMLSQPVERGIRSRESYRLLH